MPGSTYEPLYGYEQSQGYYNPALPPGYSEYYGSGMHPALVRPPPMSYSGYPYSGYYPGYPSKERS